MSLGELIIQDEPEFFALSSPIHFQCHIALVAESMGGYSVHALDLPGVVSEGESIEEALANVKEAYQLVIGSYLEEGAIPWDEAKAYASVKELFGEPQALIQKWIIVDA